MMMWCAIVYAVGVVVSMFYLSYCMIKYFKGPLKLGLPKFMFPKFMPAKCCELLEKIFYVIGCVFTIVLFSLFWVVFFICIFIYVTFFQKD